MKKTYAVVSLGYHARLCFESAENAIAFYQMLSKAVPVESTYGSLPDGRKGIDFVRDEMSISLEQHPESKFELNFTQDELRARMAAKDDVDGDAKVIDVSDAPKELTFTDVEPA